MTRISSKNVHVFNKDGEPIGELIDMSGVILNDPTVDSELDKCVIGELKDSQSFTITGRWLAYNERVCYVCHEVFAFGPEGPYEMHAEVRDFYLERFDACPSCAVALMGGGR